MRKIRRHQAITAILVVYALFMTIYFGRDLLIQGQHLRFYATLGTEIIVIIVTYIFLKKRDNNMRK